MEDEQRSKVARTMSQDHRMTTRFQALLQREKNLRDVLNNRIVCENIASYLSFADMKAATEAGRQFVEGIRETLRFGRMSVLEISDKNLGDMKLILRNTESSWRGVKIDVADPRNILEELEVLKKVLKSAGFVRLNAQPWKVQDWKVKDAAAVSLLTTVFTSTPNLSHLQLHIHFLFTDLGAVLAGPAVQETLRKLTRLDLVGMTEEEKFESRRRPFYVPLVNCSSFVDLEEADEGEKPFERNLRLLTSLPERLRSFKVTSSFPDPNQEKHSANESVLNLLKNNKGTLEELSFHLGFWRISELRTLTFPVLKILTASLTSAWGGYRVNCLGDFLKNQRSLEQLTLWSRCLSESPITAIQGISVGLRKLHLTAVMLIEMDWSFLAGMKSLKDFQVKILKVGGVEHGPKLLAFLPKNQLESLSLEGIFDRPVGFWSHDGGEMEFWLKTELLEGFRCLRRLSFLGSRDAVDDQLMQWLLTEFVSLEELELSHCSRLTDAGITGKTTAEWRQNVSLADLRCLKTLKIVKCRAVTCKGVVSSVNLPLLKSFHYFQPDEKVGESVVLKLVGGNPRLERLSVNYQGDLGKLKGKLLKKKRRVELSALAS